MVTSSQSPLSTKIVSLSRRQNPQAAVVEHSHTRRAFDSPRERAHWWEGSVGRDRKVWSSSMSLIEVGLWVC